MLSLPQYYAKVFALSMIFTAANNAIFRYFRTSLVYTRKPTICDFRSPSRMLNMSARVSIPRVDQSDIRPGLTQSSSDGEEYMFGCHNIHHINLRNHSLGVGVNKKAYYGVYDGREVALRMATYDNGNNKRCIEDGLPHLPHSECFTFGNMKLMKDILLSQQLKHPNLNKLLGFCLRSDEIKNKSPHKHGLMAVYEYGISIREWEKNKRWSLEKRLSDALEILNLLAYFEKSPLGMFGVPDLKTNHFLFVKGRATLTDLDDSTAAEMQCEKNCSLSSVQCVGGICKDYHKHNNMARFVGTAFRHFFGSQIRKNIPELARLHLNGWNGSIGTREMTKTLTEVLTKLRNKENF